MKAKSQSSLMDGLIEPLSKCLTEESAERLLRFPGKKFQTRMDKLADKCTEGTLTESEKNEYQTYVSFGDFVALLKANVRQRMASSSGKST